MECRAYGICLDSQSRGYLGKDRKVSSAAGGNLSRMHKTQETAKESRLNFMYSHLRNRTLDSAVATVEYFGDRADYVMIENSACFRSDEFKKTGLYDWLLERSVPTIVVPHISKVSLNAWEAAEQKADRCLALADVIEFADLPFIAKLELSGVRNRMLVQFEDCAPVLLPDPSLIKNKVSRVEAKVSQQQPTSRFKNPLIMKK